MYLNLFEDLNTIFTFIRQFVEVKFISQDSQSPYITFCRIHKTDTFWTQIVGCSNKLLTNLFAFFRHRIIAFLSYSLNLFQFFSINKRTFLLYFCCTKIDDAYLKVCSKDYILRFDVSMNDVVCVKIINGFNNLSKVISHYSFLFVS